MNVSLKEYIKTGEFGQLKINCSEKQFMKLLGEPEDWNKEKTLFKYSLLEISVNSGVIVGLYFSFEWEDLDTGSFGEFVDKYFIIKDYYDLAYIPIVDILKITQKLKIPVSQIYKDSIKLGNKVSLSIDDESKLSGITIVDAQRIL